MPVSNYKDKWFVDYKCKRCLAELTLNEVFNSTSCPHCNVSKAREGVLEVNETIKRKVYTFIPNIFERIYGKKEAWHWEILTREEFNKLKK